MKLIISLGKGVLKFIYFFIKMFPIRDQVVFISRQSNKPSMDIEMLVSSLEHRGMITKLACRTLGGGLGNHVRYCFHMIRQMYLIATSGVVVLDSYCIVASLLHHKKKTKIVQMWHALGSLKKFGYSIVDMEEGSSRALAVSMKMHRSYDYIFTSSSISRRAFAEAFDSPEEKFRVLSLPRVDALLDKKRDAEVAKKIYNRYPILKTKKNILYAPTFRRHADINLQILNLIDVVDYDNYNLIIKLHPLSKYSKADMGQAIFDKEYTTLDMLSISNYVITDYSAVTYEAALKGKPLYFYSFDLEEYLKDRSFYIDYENEMPGLISSSARDILSRIEEDNFDIGKVTAFADKYIENKRDCTKEITCFLEELLEK